LPADQENSASQGLAKQQLAALTATVSQVNFVNQTYVPHVLALPTTETALYATGQQPFATQAFVKTAVVRKQPAPVGRSVTLPTSARLAPRATTLCVFNATVQPAFVRQVLVHKEPAPRMLHAVAAPFVKTECAQLVAAIPETPVAKHATATIICASAVAASSQTAGPIVNAATASFVCRTCAPLVRTWMTTANAQRFLARATSAKQASAKQAAAPIQHVPMANFAKTLFVPRAQAPMLTTPHARHVTPQVTFARQEPAKLVVAPTLAVAMVNCASLCRAPLARMSQMMRLVQPSTATAMYV